MMFYRREGKIWGKIKGNTLYKVIKSSKHLLRKGNALCFDLGMLDYCQEKGIRRIEVYDKESGNRYVGDLNDILRYGERIDFGHGIQVAIPLHFFKVLEQRKLL